MRSSITGDVSASWEMDIPHKRCRISCEQYEGISKFRSMSHDWLFIKEDLPGLSMQDFTSEYPLRIWKCLRFIEIYEVISMVSVYIVVMRNSSVTYPSIWRCGVSCGRCECECGGCASPVKNDRISLRRFYVSHGISYGRFARISKFRDMWHDSYISYTQICQLGIRRSRKTLVLNLKPTDTFRAMKSGVPFSVEVNIDTYTKT
jgi:hypothetical protein